MIPFAYLALEEIEADFVITNRTIVRVADLTDQVRYSLVSYAPSIAPLRPRTIAGGGDYAEVQDTIAVDVLGDTAASCAANYEELVDLIDQAGRWWDGESVNPVRLAGELQRSTVGRVYTSVLGAPSGQPPAQVSPELDAMLGRWVIRGVQLAVIRRGRWLGPTDPNLTPTLTATNPAIGTITLAAGTPRSPIFLSTVPTNGAAAAPQWVAISESADGIQIFDWSTRTAVGFTTVADAANRPYQGTNILRYTPASTAYATSGAAALASATQDQTYAVLAAVRTSGAQAFLVRPVIGGVSGRVTVIDTSPTTPQVINLGTVSIGPSNTATVALQVAAVSTSGGPTLDISYVALVNLSLPNTFLWRYPIGGNLVAVHFEYGDLRASVGGRQLGVAVQDEREGAIDLTMGETINIAAFAQNGARWTLENAAGTAKDVFVYAVGRRNAYRTLQ